MSRRAKPPKGKAEAKRPLARKSAKDDAAKVEELESRLAEALEERAALSEILRVISESPTDLQPVFDAIVASSDHPMISRRRFVVGLASGVLAAPRAETK